MSDTSTNGLSSRDDHRDMQDTVMVAFAGLTVLVWDHFITLDDEVELIWKRDKGLLAYLFLLNRYLTPLGFIVNLVGELTRFPAGAQNCKHFVRYEGAMTVVGTQIAGLMMFLRVRALYRGNRAVLCFVILLFLAWLGVNAWLLTYGQPVPHVSGLHSCSMVFDTPSGNAASASAWFPLLYDTCIFALTVYKTKYRMGYIIRTMLSDGILYYSVICVVNVVLTVMIVRATDGLKNIAAQLELLLTVAMVSRITLNLRRQATRDNVYLISNDWTPSRPPQSIWARLAGTLRTHSRTNAFTPRRRRVIASYPEHVQLSAIRFINVTITPIEAIPVSEEVETT